MSHSHVVILGMRRSGTSVLAELMGRLGYSVENNSKQADENNARGYYESKSIIDLNTSVMAELGGNRIFPPKCPLGWEKRRQFIRFRNEAMSVIGSYNVHPRWVMKDTRFSITLPLWRPILPKDTRFIICIRNPLSCVRSWARMSAEPVDKKSAYRAWECFTSFAIKNTMGVERMAVLQEDYAENEVKQYQRLARFLGESGDLTKFATYSNSLVHQVVHSSDFFEDPDARPSLKTLYRQILQEGRTPFGLDQIGERLGNFEGFQPPLLLRLRLNSRKLASMLLRPGGKSVRDWQ